MLLRPHVTLGEPTSIVAEAASLERMKERLGRLAVPGIASIGAGAIHAAAIGAHADPRIAAVTFTVTAAFQLIWGITALTSSDRRFAIVGAVGNAGLVVGWIVARTSGLPIDGLDHAESIGVADGIAAALATVAALTALVRAIDLRPEPRGPRAVLVVGSAVAVIAASVTGMIAVTGHDAAGAGGADHHGGAEVATAAGGADTTAAVPPKPYDPTLPIDLGGVPGVSLQEQAAAENVLSATVLRLPKWSDPAVAEAAGFRSIGDGATGEEHYVHPEWMRDPNILDPDQPESLVYDTTQTPKKLVAAMYMLPPGETLESAPDFGGELTQWHIHNNLCFTPEGRVGGLTNGEGGCDLPLVKGPEQPMIHVWIVPHPCGPFAALDGIAGGQIKQGETKLCDTAHGGH